MTTIQISARQLKESVERKAYAYGISEPVCVLLGEYVVELIKNIYANPAKQLVPKPLGQN